MAPTQAPAVVGHPDSAPPRSGGLARLLGRKTDAEKAAERDYGQLLSEVAAGRVNIRTVRSRLQELAGLGGLRDRDRIRLHDRAFRGVAERVLADDRLSEQEEQELFAVAAWLGLSGDDLQARSSDLMERLQVARINDERLPTVSNPRLLVKRGEVVHAEIPAALLKEVVHREYRGGGGGVSVPIGLGMRFNTGGFRGRSVVVGTSLQPADTGTLSISNIRIVFQGMKKNQESRLDRLTGVEVFTDALRIGVSNRQNASLYRVQRGIVAGALVTAVARRALHGESSS